MCMRRPRPLANRVFGDRPARPQGLSLLRPVLAALVLFAASVEALAGPVEDDWSDLALTRCAQAMIDAQDADESGLAPLDPLTAELIDVRSAGLAWAGATGAVRLAHMQHAAGGRIYVGCRVAFTPAADPLAPPSVPVSIPDAIAAFEAWFAAAQVEHAFLDIHCPTGPRSYARKIKTRDLAPEEVQVSVVFEVGPDADWIFFAAVEEPLGQGECLG
ncbi:hypothetical protein P2H44_09480 [Albimonas sp. CAU 1670]|uniref:hypothetical protein n=1 Tax=Albimonas sp. CAU 1670 TaxID=3032599 RepID=UPI0023D9D536|nr:hypothetical protein [Albimonas sp. CAU 1670]MDF2232783.1 hypothetical protein [Albimonas sp. CAU 1670]